MRLDKYLANMGVGTRSEVKKMIGYGQVAINGKCVKKINASVSEGVDHVTVKGEVIGYTKHVYLMLHKPAGVLSATEDAKAPTVMDLIHHPRKQQLFPVGRLDKDTEGLLLLTDDGQLSHRLLSPKKHVDKCYYAKIDGQITQRHIKMFSDGLVVDDEFTALPAELKILVAGAESEVELTIQEGKFHQVKRMFQTIGTEVTYLKRLSMGALVLDEGLAKGKSRELTQEEIDRLIG